jgi:hypothetical protein
MAIPAFAWNIALPQGVAGPQSASQWVNKPGTLSHRNGHASQVCHQ